MSVLRLVSPVDLTTVLFDFNDPTGASNGGVATTLLDDAFGLGGGASAAKGSTAMGVKPETLEFAPVNDPGGQMLRRRYPLRSESFTFLAQAASVDVLRAGLANLANLLDTLPASGVLRFQPTGASAPRFVDAVSSPAPVLFDATAARTLQVIANVAVPVTVEIRRQPYDRTALVTQSAQVVPMDPASAGARTYRLTVAGEMPTPAQVQIFGDGGSALVWGLVGVHAGADTADYVSSAAGVGTFFASADTSGNGWTVTLGSGVSAVADTAASGGATAQGSVAVGTTPTRFVRVTRTTLLDSLRGEFEVWCRAQLGANQSAVLNLAWAPSLANPAPFARPGVTFAANGTPAYQELRLGRFWLDEEAALAGLALEVQAYAAQAATLSIDSLFLVPVQAGAGVLTTPSGLPALGYNASFLTDPEHALAWALDNTYAVSGPAHVAGPIPAWLPPGDVALYVAVQDQSAAQGGVVSTLSRTPTVRVSYYPRWMT